jgi:hypothetical protein
MAFAEFCGGRRRKALGTASVSYPDSCNLLPHSELGGGVSPQTEELADNGIWKVKRLREQIREYILIEKELKGKLR